MASKLGKLVSKGGASVQKWMGGVVGVGIIALILTACIASIQKKKREEGFREGFMDCGSGFCAPPS
jgi:hypothetical protein